MQISRISAQSFGCQRCTNVKKNDNNAQQKVPSNAFAISRNALIAGLVSLMTSCSPCDTYYLSTTPEGEPVIFNQDGDTIDFLPKEVKDEYEALYGADEVSK